MDSLNNDINEITDQEIDLIADTTLETLENLLSYFNVDNIEINELTGNDNELIFDITGDDLSILIGKHGSTLDAIQYLTTTHVYKKIDKRYPVVIDINGYKERRFEKIESIAQNAAQKVVKFNKKIKLKPMTPYERRIVHMFLSDNEEVETASQGQGSSRYVILYPKK